jgi:hypothetical protein
MKRLLRDLVPVAFMSFAVVSGLGLLFDVATGKVFRVALCACVFACSATILAHNGVKDEERRLRKERERSETGPVL